MRGPKKPEPPDVDQKLSMLTVESGTPAGFSCTRWFWFGLTKTLSSPTAPCVSGGMVKVVVPIFGPSSCARKLCEGAGEGAAGLPGVSPCAGGAELERDFGRFVVSPRAGESGIVSGA